METVDERFDEKEIWFVRHGQSEANAGRATAAPGMTRLTTVGRMQADAIARAVSAPPALLVTSPFLRARQTAEPTSARHPSCSLEVWPVQEFTYLDSSKYRGTTVEQRAPLTRAYWSRLDPTYRDGPDAETFVELFDRVEQTLARLRRTRGLTIVFTHGQLMRAILWRALGDFHSPDRRAMRAFSRFRLSIGVPNGAMFRLRFGRGDLLWTSNVLTAHLPSELVTR